MMLKSLPLLLIGLAFTYPVSAQVIPDNSLGSEGSIVTPEVTVKDAVADFIEGGATRGNNLFHSFSEFNVSTGNNVYFANPDGVVNILNRVTGNNASNIFGTLGVDGGANLFLLNPNGIVFGENAALDVSGSFMATTADSYLFDNDFEYSASNPDVPPMLTIDLPVGVQLGNNPGSITVEGTGHNLGLDFLTFTPIRDNRPVGLEVETGNTLALLGGEIDLRGGNLTALQGRVELGSVGATETVGLNPTNDGFTIEYDQINDFSEINLTNAASIEVSGSGGGNVNLRGKDISLIENSTIIANTLGTDNGGQIGLTASESVEVISIEDEFLSSILTHIEVGATGNGGNLSIDAKKLEITDGAISTATVGAGNSGDLTVDAESIEIKKTSTQVLPTGLFSTVGFSSATGKGGNLTVNSDRIVLEDGAQIASGTYGTGNSGDLTVDAKLIEVRNISSQGIHSGLFNSVATPSATGKGGNLTVNSDRLILEDGGHIGSGTFGIGNSGDLSIESESITIDGTSFINPEGKNEISASTLFASVESTGTGDGGNLTVKTPQLHLTNGGQIKVSTSGEGNGGNLTIVTNDLHLLGGGQISASSFGMADAGNIKIQANDINVSGVLINEPISNIRPELFPSNISAFSQGEYTSGSITIDSNNFHLSDRGNVSVSNLGSGNSGNIKITANELNLNRATIEARVNAGDRGNINLATDNITLNDRSQITVQATGTATGGNITIDNSNLILVRNNSDIKANAVFGWGGNISILTELIFTDLTSDINASSEFGLEGVVEITSPDLEKELGEVILPTEITDLTSLITVTCMANDHNSVAVIGNGGIAKSPYQTQSLNTTWNDLRRVKQQPRQVATLPTPLIEADSTVINASGELELVALNTSSTHGWINSSCSK